MPHSATRGALLPHAWRVEVFRREGVHDPEGVHALGGLREAGAADLASVRAGRGYLLPPELAREDVERLVRELLADPVTDVARVIAPSEAPCASEDGCRRVLVAPKAGVTDPEAQAVHECLVREQLVLADADSHVGTFRAFELAGGPSGGELHELSRRALANETIQSLLVEDESLHYGTPASEAHRGRVELSLLAADAAELARISKEGQLSLDDAEMSALQAHFRGLEREPTACELETLAQTWSEHCKHKTLTGSVELEHVTRDAAGAEVVRRASYDNLLKETIAHATHTLDREWCVSVFVDNAGIVRFDEEHDVCIKVETHNHPSAIDPYGGAGTGIGGVIRDILGAGMGARPIANLDAFFVGPLDLPREELPRGTLHPRRILRGVVDGVRDYGNRMGIPTLAGGVWFHERYVGNPLVFAGTVGLLPRNAADKEARPGDLVVAAGGRTGRDGIHGATFSSVELSEESEVTASSAVQIGDPVTEKKLTDCQLEARERGLYRCVTDCGAGGFSSAVGEMGEATGVEVELDAVPLKYPGLSSHEVWISEAQERMVFAVPPEKADELLALFAAEDVEATVIGRFTDDKKLTVRDAGELVAELDMEFLHNGAPQLQLRGRWVEPQHPEPGCPTPGDWKAALLDVLGAPDVQSRAWILRQYDHEVQGRSVVKPLVGPRGEGPGDGAVIAPSDSSSTGLALGCGTQPAYGILDPWAMAAAAIDEAMRNVVAVGGDPDRTAILDNFSWGNCRIEDRMGAMVLACEACRDAALAYRTPFVSGKDSLNNEYRVGDTTISIPSTLLITAMAIVPEAGRALTMDLKRAGNAVYQVGATDAELGGSQYLLRAGLEGGRAPRPDLERAPLLLRDLHAALAAGLARACHDLSEGGLGVAAAEMAFAGGLGMQLELGAAPRASAELSDACALFSESCTRFLVEVEPDSAAAFEAALAAHPCAQVGRVVEEQQLLVLGSDGTELLRAGLDELADAHRGDFHG